MYLTPHYYHIATFTTSTASSTASAASTNTRTTCSINARTTSTPPQTLPLSPSPPPRHPLRHAPPPSVFAHSRFNVPTLPSSHLSHTRQLLAIPINIAHNILVPKSEQCLSTHSNISPTTDPCLLLPVQPMEPLTGSRIFP